MEINYTFEDIRNMKKRTFRNIVNKQVNESSFRYLLSQIKSKGKEINYSKELKCQEYLKPNSILTIKEQLNIFSYRSKMNNFEYNYPGNKKNRYLSMWNNDDQPTSL